MSLRDLRPMHNTTATISAVELKDLLGEIDAENVDFHDEPPHIWVSTLVSLEGGAGSISVNSGGSILKAHIDQRAGVASDCAEAAKLSVLLQAALRTTTATICTERTIISESDLAGGGSRFWHSARGGTVSLTRAARA